MLSNNDAKFLKCVFLSHVWIHLWNDSFRLKERRKIKRLSHISNFILYVKLWEYLKWSMIIQNKAMFETKGTIMFRGSMGKGGWIILTFSMGHNGVLWAFTAPKQRCPDSSYFMLDIYVFFVDLNMTEKGSW